VCLTSALTWCGRIAASPAAASSSPASATENRSSAARSSRNAPLLRRRASGNGGSCRVDRISRSPAGRLRSRFCTPCSGSGWTSSCRSSRTSRIGAGNAARPSTTSPRKAVSRLGWAAGIGIERNRLSSGTAGQAAIAASTPDQNRWSSLSSCASDSQAVPMPSGRRTHSVSNSVLPDPAGAQISVVAAVPAWSSAASRRGRDTSWDGTLGTVTFTRATRLDGTRGHGNRSDADPAMDPAHPARSNMNRFHAHNCTE
jgi:hypothetical protein